MTGLDDLLGGLHHDRVRSLRRQLAAVRREGNTRHLVSAEHHLNLQEQIARIDATILRLLPQNDFCADPYLAMREKLFVERRALEQEVTEELINRWRDEQALRTEERRLREALLEEQERYERHLRDYAA